MRTDDGWFECTHRTPGAGASDERNMAILTHEIWEECDEHGQSLGVCIAGPRGDSFRSLLEPNARLVRTFEAGSHVEAMSIYYRLYGFGEYKTDYAMDYEPYPEEWAMEQRGEG